MTDRRIGAVLESERVELFLDLLADRHKVKVVSHFFLASNVINDLCLGRL
jgi:hypothetical protein